MDHGIDNAQKTKCDKNGQGLFSLIRNRWPKCPVDRGAGIDGAPVLWLF
jgi:hypothetical protein